MRRLPILLVIIAAFSRCGTEAPDEPHRTPIALDNFAVPVKEHARGYMLSDKKGGFLSGMLAPHAGNGGVLWSVDGRNLLTDLKIVLAGRGEQTLDSALVRADRVTLYYGGGTTAQIAPLEFPGNDVHAFVLLIRAAQRSEISVSLSATRDNVSLFAVPPGVPMPESLVLPESNEATVLMTDLAAKEALPRCASLYPLIDSLMRARTERMERLLNRMFLRTSDDQLNRSLYWMKLSVDALIVKGQDTFAVAGLPWDGSLQCRENAESVAEIGRTTGDFVAASAICRNLMRWQDTVYAHSSFGRLAREVVNSSPVYDAADVGPMFVREMYDHIVSSDDTSLVNGLYAFVRTGIAGTRRYHTDAKNLLVHGEGETWMSGARRGNRAAEVEQYWYFQQMIGAYLAAHAGDRAVAREWGRLATQTAAAFQEAFIDTAHNLVYDHVLANGSGSPDLRPNPLLCLELLGSELVQQEMIKKMVNTLVYPYGVGTLGSQDRRFRANGAAAGGGQRGWKYEGPVWTWLAGPFAYALTRYDRQDLCYQVTREMARRSLTEGVVGTIPEMYEAAPRPGETEPRAAGLRASLTGMTQFLASWEQNYLGVRVDGPANLLSMEPKLPPGMTSVDFTLFMGRHGISGTIVRDADLTRITLFAPDLEKGLQCSFLWVLDDGDAWKVAADLPPRARLTLVIGRDDVAAFLGDKKAELKEIRRLSKFSLKGVFAGVTLASAQN